MKCFCQPASYLLSDLCSVIRRYVDQLEDEQFYRSDFGLRNTSSYYPHQPLDASTNQGLLNPHGEFLHIQTFVQSYRCFQDTNTLIKYILMAMSIIDDDGHMMLLFLQCLLPCQIWRYWADGMALTSTILRCMISRSTKFRS